jgi:hypothetical protein
LKIPKGGNQNPYINKEQTTQWPKEKAQKNKQRSTKHTYKTKDRVTRTPLKTRGQLRCSGRVSSSCSTSDTHRVNLVARWLQELVKFFFINVWRKSVFDIYFTELDTALTTVLPVLFKYCYKYCYSDSRKRWAVMKGGGLAL